LAWFDFGFGFGLELGTFHFYYCATNCCKYLQTENSTQAGENLMLTDAHNYPRMDFQLGEIYVHFSNAHGSLVN